MIKPSDLMKHVGNTPFDARLDAVGLEGVGRAHLEPSPCQTHFANPAPRRRRPDLFGGAGHRHRQPSRAVRPKDRFCERRIHRRQGGLGRHQPGPCRPRPFQTFLQDVQAHLTDKSVFVKDAAVGADERYRIPVRVVAEKAWSSLFVDNMFIRLSEEEKLGGEPRVARHLRAKFPSGPCTPRMSPGNVSAIDFGSKDHCGRWFRLHRRNQKGHVLRDELHPAGGA